MLGMLHHGLEVTGWLATPVAPQLVPTSLDPGWGAFLWQSAEALAWLFVFLVELIALMGLLPAAGLLHALEAALMPLLRLVGIRPNAAPIAVVGRLLGLAYGDEARSTCAGHQDIP